MKQINGDRHTKFQPAGIGVKVMKNYKVNVKSWNEAIPDNNIWDSDTFPDYIEAESREEALYDAMGYIMDCIDENNGKWIIDPEEEREYQEPCEINLDGESIDYTNEDGYRCSILFNVVEIEED